MVWDEQHFLRMDVPFYWLQLDIRFALLFPYVSALPVTSKLGFFRMLVLS